jgi:hypothetical protein
VSDAIEVHFDKKRGYLELGCESDAFTPFRELVRTQLADLTDIPLDKVTEISVIDTDAVVRERSSLRQRLIGIAICVLLFVTAAFAIIGMVATATWLRG